MKFDQLDRIMRVYETASDSCVLPELWMVARLDGRSFTRLTKEICQFRSPFDERFRDLMINTTRAVMDCGFRTVYGYTESDEISLLFAIDEVHFGRKLRKYLSLLAAEASAAFTLQLGKVATFDCRISQLPNFQRVVDYFRWRQEDATRNALNGWCYWTLRRTGKSAREATDALLGLTTADKNELLWSHGINFQDVPLWQKRGVALFWDQIPVVGRDGRTNEPVTSQRRRLVVETELPMKDAYDTFLTTRITPKPASI